MAEQKAKVDKMLGETKRLLKVNVSEGKNLKDVETFGTMDPYVILTLGTSTAPLPLTGPLRPIVMQTKAAKSGGVRPVPLRPCPPALGVARSLTGGAQARCLSRAIDVPVVHKCAAVSLFALNLSDGPMDSATVG